MAQITSAALGRPTVRRYPSRRAYETFLVIELAEIMGAGMHGHLTLTLNEARELRDDLSRNIKIIEAREEL